MSHMMIEMTIVAPQPKILKLMRRKVSQDSCESFGYVVMRLMQSAAMTEHTM